MLDTYILNKGTKGQTAGMDSRIKESTRRVQHEQCRINIMAQNMLCGVESPSHCRRW